MLYIHRLYAYIILLYIIICFSKLKTLPPNSICFSSVAFQSFECPLERSTAGGSFTPLVWRICQQKTHGKRLESRLDWPMDQEMAPLSELMVVHLLWKLVGHWKRSISFSHALRARLPHQWQPHAELERMGCRNISGHEKKMSTGVNSLPLDVLCPQELDMFSIYIYIYVYAYIYIYIYYFIFNYIYILNHLDVFGSQDCEGPATGWPLGPHADLGATTPWAGADNQQLWESEKSRAR